MRFQLSWIPSGDYAYAFVAKELGFWSELGLDVQIDRGFGSSRTASDVAAGQYEVGEASFSMVANTVSKGGALVGLGARYQKSPIGIMALKKKGLKRPKDLEGMTVGSAPGSAASVLFPAFARATGIDASKVTFQALSPGAGPPSMLAGKVDALATFYNSSAPSFIAKGIAFDFLFFADHGLDMLDQTFITQPRTLKENREMVGRFVEGALKGAAYTYLHPEKAVEITLRHLQGQTREIVEVALGVATALGLSSLVEQKGIGWMDPALVGGSVDKVVRYMGGREIRDVGGLYTNEFIGKVQLTADQWEKARSYGQKYLPS
ncbi:MAG: ABC transporter substrate-binding protein [Deltaproteobacteria bacterium]|nr:ABC transporter substrate-binding protein [Deltaproteobacteria bacterium]MBI3078834.1 ABC transporter substrate-binding protein [Deltaproteobacteria bacterium]